MILLAAPPTSSSPSLLTILGALGGCSALILGIPAGLYRWLQTRSDRSRKAGPEQAEANLKSIEAANVLFDRYEKDKAELRGEIAELRDRCDRVVGEVETERAKRHQAEEAAAEAKQRVGELEQRVAELEQELGRTRRPPGARTRREDQETGP